jgi:hypothetical protein
LNDPDPDDGGLLDDGLPAPPQAAEELLEPTRLVGLDAMDVDACQGPMLFIILKYFRQKIGDFDSNFCYFGKHLLFKKIGDFLRKRGEHCKSIVITLTPMFIYRHKWLIPCFSIALDVFFFNLSPWLYTYACMCELF